MTDKLRLDMADLTLGELAQVGDLLGVSLTEAMQGPQQTRAMAAIACVVMQRTNPAATFQDALQLRMSDLEVVNADDPSGQSGGNTGDAPRLLPASGE